MGLRNKTRMKVWEFENKTTKSGKETISAKVSTSRKVGDTWKTDFSARCNFYGEAYKKLKGRLTEGCSISVTEFDLQISYNKELARQFISLSIFDADLLNDKGEVIPFDEEAAKKAAESTPSTGFMNIADDLPDLPFN